MDDFFKYYLCFCIGFVALVHIFFLGRDIGQLEIRLAKLEAELITPQEVAPPEEKTTNDKIVDLLEDIRDLCYIRSNP